MGKVILITGGISGIGRAAARAFAAQGDAVVVAGRREEEGKGLEAELRALGQDVTFIRTDVRHEVEVAALLELVVARFHEANYPPVLYIPREDVDMAALSRSETRTYCPYKGEAAYFSIPAGGEPSADAIWTYEAPFDAVAEIKDRLAFYPDRVDLIEEVAS